MNLENIKVVLTFCITIIITMFYIDFFTDNFTGGIFILFLGSGVSLVPLFFLKMFGIKSSEWIFMIFESIPNGFALGLSLGSLFILDKWYSKPDSGFYEPLFVATGLVVAGIWTLKKDIVRK